MKKKPIDFMRYIYGSSPDDCKCGDCLNFTSYRAGNKKICKCKAYGVTCSSESDFAMRWPGCGLFNKPVSGQTVEDSWKRSYARMNRESDLSGEKEIPGQLKLEG